MRSRAQPKYACGVFGSKGSVYNDWEKVVNNFSGKSHRKTRLVLEEQKELAAKSFFKLFERPVNRGQVSGIHEHRCRAVFEFG
jgi:hypothetical protein